ncbi:hypothetical protein JVT61DRAFT_12150 [Boletus reticuloceps]|uniref:Uncharacterized protein n=1 Tax=Boletus reticuloceps TaxID=495285 RepID=A0A8I3A3D2_9AGAM|nr:hypothetical protein JVT61DRAFT_12150 [Boletus reticuloceps]
MLVHLRGQLGCPAPPPLQNSPPKPGGPPSAPAKPPPAKTAEPSDLVALVHEMRAELDRLKEEVRALTFSLVASSPPPSTTAACTVVPTAPPSNPPSSLSSVSTALSRVAHPSHPWLQPILDHKDLPTYLHHVDSEMVPTFHLAVPDDVPSVVAIHTPGLPPIYIGIDSNGDLTVSRNIANPELVTIGIIVDFTGVDHPLLPLATALTRRGPPS